MLHSMSKLNAVLHFDVQLHYTHAIYFLCVFLNVVAKPPRRSGKDMSNITGLSDLADDKPSTGKQKKRTRHLTTLDSEESEDDSEEFQLSE